MPEEYENLAEASQDIVAERHQVARHGATGRPGWLDALAVSTALFAVLAATPGGRPCQRGPVPGQ